MGDAESEGVMQVEIIKVLKVIKVLKEIRDYRGYRRKTEGIGALSLLLIICPHPVAHTSPGAYPPPLPKGEELTHPLPAKRDSPLLRGRVFFIYE